MTLTLPVLADFLTAAQGAHPDLSIEPGEDAPGEECIFMRWGSHTLTITAWVDTRDGSEGLTITHDQNEQAPSGGVDPLATVVELIVEHIDETGIDVERGEALEDAKPGTFSARIWVARNQAIIERAQARITRLDPEGRYSVKQP
jgi:hypothetical protein